MKVKINQKNYEVSDNWDFREMAGLESAGLDVITIMTKNQIFLAAVAMIIVAVGCDYDEAINLANQHVLGGGNAAELSSTFMTGVQSDFFQKWMENMEKSKKTPSVAK